MTAVVVRCPSCMLLLEAPVGAPAFKCPCGLVLASPTAVLPSVRSGTILESAQSSTQLGHRSAETTPCRDAGERDGSQSPLDQAGLSALQHTCIDNSPPVYTENSARKDCQQCFAGFTLFTRRHHCRSCGALVCGNCSGTRWPASMLPSSFNLKSEKLVRICNKCQTSVDKFRAACLNGDLEGAQLAFKSGVIQLGCPYTIYPSSMFPIHCAATSGSVPLMQWLIAKGCFVKVHDGRGFTALAAAAQKGHFDLVNFLVQNGHSSVEEITDRDSLQQCLAKAIQRIGPANLSCEPEMSHSSTQSHPSSSLVGTSAHRPSAPSAPPQFDIPPPSYSQFAGLNRDSSSTVPQAEQRHILPASAGEEEEQLQMALSLSRLASSISDESNAAQAIPCQVQPTPTNSSPTPNASECIVCFDAPVGTCFVPCGHACVCTTCATALGSSCPVCRREIDQVIRTFNISS